MDPPLPLSGHYWCYHNTAIDLSRVSNFSYKKHELKILYGPTAISFTIESYAT